MLRCSLENISNYCLQITIRIFVIVQNINDNPPVFAQNLYTLNVDEVRLTLHSHLKAHDLI